MMLVEDRTVKSRTAMKTMFLYLIVYLSVMLDIISCSFTSISLDTNQQYKRCAYSLPVKQITHYHTN